MPNENVSKLDLHQIAKEITLKAMHLGTISPATISGDDYAKKVNSFYNSVYENLVKTDKKISGTKLEDFISD